MSFICARSGGLRFAGLAAGRHVRLPSTLRYATLRIVGNERYPGTPGPPAKVARVLAELCVASDHRFWPDDINPLASAFLPIARLPRSRDLTDSYLLALAAQNGGVFATFDRKLMTSAVPNGNAHVEFIE